jgi:hypothetical protein
MANTYQTIISGVKKLVEALTSSSGASDAGKIPALDSDGKLDVTMLPIAAIQTRIFLGE